MRISLPFRSSFAFAANRRLSIQAKIAVGFFILCAGNSLRAQIISEAFLVFPIETESLEYDNLSILRNLPNYSALRQQFSGTVVQQARLAISRFDIREEQVDEIVLGSTRASLWGLLGGTFNGSAARRTALKKGVHSFAVNGNQIFCPGAGICLVFLENSIAGFGTSEQLRSMLKARQGITPHLSSNRNLLDLFYGTDRSAPIRGAAPGSQLNELLANAFQGPVGKHIDWLRYSRVINAFGYSVNLDSKAHISATLECKTSTEAALLRDMLGALAGLESLAIQAGKDSADMAFQNLQVSSSGRIVELKVETPIPGS